MPYFPGVVSRTAVAGVDVAVLWLEQDAGTLLGHYTSITQGAKTAHIEENMKRKLFFLSECESGLRIHGGG